MKFEHLETTFDDYSSKELVVSYLLNDKLGVEIRLDYDILCMNIYYEPDSCPTYVPYGEQSVLLDDGKGDICEIETDGCCRAIKTTYYDREFENQLTELSEKDIIKYSGLSEEEFKKDIEELERLAEKEGDTFLRNYYMDDYSRLPNLILED